MKNQTYLQHVPCNLFLTIVLLMAFFLEKHIIHDARYYCKRHFCLLTGENYKNRGKNRGKLQKLVIFSTCKLYKDYEEVINMQRVILWHCSR
jgi:hypothetical protein